MGSQLLMVNLPLVWLYTAHVPFKNGKLDRCKGQLSEKMNKQLVNLGPTYAGSLISVSLTYSETTTAFSRCLWLPLSLWEWCHMTDRGLPLQSFCQPSFIELSSICKNAFRFALSFVFVFSVCPFPLLFTRHAEHIHQEFNFIFKLNLNLPVCFFFVVVVKVTEVANESVRKSCSQSVQVTKTHNNMGACEMCCTHTHTHTPDKPETNELLQLRSWGKELKRVERWEKRQRVIITSLGL